MEPSRFDTLTARQRECLRMLAEPMRPKEIAAALSLSARTVEDHLATAVQRLGATSSIHAARLLAEHERGTRENLREGVSRIEETVTRPPDPSLPVDALPASRGRRINLGAWERSAIIVGLTVALIFSVFIVIAGGETLAGVLKHPQPASPS